MNTLSVELSDTLTKELDQLVSEGWFMDKNEIIRLVLLEFVQRHQFALIEKFQHEDIQWALQQKTERKG